MHRHPEPRQTGNTFGFTAWRGMSSVMAAPHAHNDIEVNFCAAPLTYDAGGRTSTLPAGVPCAFWGARPHQLIDIEPDQPLAFITIPLAQFMQWGVPASMQKRLLHGDILRGPSHDTQAGLEALFDRWAHDLHRAQGDLRARAAELEIEGLLIRMSLGEWSETAPDTTRASRDLRRAADMATFIAANAGSAVRVPDVAKAVHLHPNRAATIFREVFRTSISAYLSQFRVAEAQRLLLTTDLSSAAIGVEAGFQSVSSYHETFAAICGSPPTQWRRQHLTERA